LDLSVDAPAVLIIGTVAGLDLTGDLTGDQTGHPTGDETGLHRLVADLTR
jgi:hypothetical protein